MCVLIFRFLGSTEHINNTVCGCYSRRHIYFPLPSKELCLSPIHCLPPHISEHKLITCHLAQQINYFHSPPHRPHSQQHLTSSPSTPSYSLNALSKYCLSLVRFNDSLSSDWFVQICFLYSLQQPLTFITVCAASSSLSAPDPQNCTVRVQCNVQYSAVQRLTDCMCVCVCVCGWLSFGYWAE